MWKKSLLLWIYWKLYLRRIYIHYFKLCCAAAQAKLVKSEKSNPTHTHTSPTHMDHFIFLAWYSSYYAFIFFKKIFIWKPKLEKKRGGCVCRSHSPGGHHSQLWAMPESAASSRVPLGLSSAAFQWHIKQGAESKVEQLEYELCQHCGRLFVCHATIPAFISWFYRNLCQVKYIFVVNILEELMIGIPIYYWLTRDHVPLAGLANEGFNCIKKKVNVPTDY